MSDFIAVGHFSIDRVFLPGSKLPLTVLGGSVAYSSFTARRLGLTVSVISKVGNDFPTKYLSSLKQEGIDLSGVTIAEHEKTTSFELKYTNDMSSRELQLVSKAPAITVDDMPKSLKAKVIHVAPITNEISYPVLEQLRKQTQYLSLDPQGLIRVFNESGKASLCYEIGERLFRFVDIYKSTADEARTITGLSDLVSSIKEIHSRGVKIVVITLGIDGALISFNETIHHIPASEAKRIVDPTGAGDVFAGGFLAEYLREDDLLWCACVGSAAASLSVETSGLQFLGSRLKIYQRARLLYGKEIKQLHLS